MTAAFKEKAQLVERYFLANHWEAMVTRVVSVKIDRQAIEIRYPGGVSDVRHTRTYMETAMAGFFRDRPFGSPAIFKRTTAGTPNVGYVYKVQDIGCC